ncbi:hypothetical protein N780_13315 [Pontibacillus chungwhensis BH030062]|uniref:Uncharacterized protein n=1 Tax=Pontibacillus chungwhensis BH030062 TaxID=1385513 RepID=A0A0A2UYA5_9BACI|nr:hypothetical protein [Pontibacillus chungwhensis]KGP93262.1 hypothetical protein N780_13315 [Pontibacillus chungwhensis BH030062]
MKVRLTQEEREQLESYLKVLQNPFESIAKRRLAKSKFDMIYNRAATRTANSLGSCVNKENQAACSNEGEENPSNL